MNNGITCTAARLLWLTGMTVMLVPLVVLPAGADVVQLRPSVAETQRALAGQAKVLGLQESSGAVPRHRNLADAVRTLMGRHAAMTSEIERKLVALDAIPSAEQEALTRVVDAFLTLDDAAERRAAEAAVLGPLAGLSDVMAARAALFDAAASLSSTPSTFSADATPLQLPPWFSLSTTATSNDTYDVDFALLIDLGGNDTYDNNAGGSNLHGGLCELAAVTPFPAAALVDLDGTDSYASGRSCGANGGGAALGAGFLFDGGMGDDTYLAGDFGTNGGGDFGGVGFLYDEAGVTSYEAGGGGTNGGGALGVGLLVDGAGRDTYTAMDSGANGGAALGLGRLVDLGGNDSYAAGSVGTNGGANGGIGRLVDLSGDDTYSAGATGTNGGGSAGSGLLLDGGGHDVYTDGQGGSGTNVSVVPKGAVGAQFDVQSLTV